MKLLTVKKEPTLKIAVGDTVQLKFYYFDGRVTETTTEKATVVKVNKVTFDAETVDGKIYRTRFTENSYKLLTN